MKAPAALLLTLLGVTLLASCDAGVGSTAGGSPAPKRPRSQPAAAPDPGIREAISAAQTFDVGHTVHVTDGGLRPLSLASQCCDPIVFKNETGSPVSIVFSVSRLESGPIAPGATWQWTPPNPESVVYRLGSDANQAGHIQIESSGW